MFFPFIPIVTRVPITLISPLLSGSTITSTALAANRTVVCTILPPAAGWAVTNTSKLRVLIKAPTAGALIINEMCVSTPATSGQLWNSASDIVNLQFAGSDGVTLTTTTPDRYSDWATFAFGGSTALMFATDVASGSRLPVKSALGTRFHTWVKDAQEADDTVRGASYSGTSGVHYFNVTVEVATS